MLVINLLFQAGIGSSSMCVLLPILSDNTSESTEQFLVRITSVVPLGGSSSVTIGENPEACIYIIDDDRKL